MTVSRLRTVEGIILKRRSVGEADRILTVFTKDGGKIRVIAKGVRRINSRRAGHIEMLQRALLTLYKSTNREILTEAQKLPLGTENLPSLEQVSYGYYVCELVDRLLPEGQEHADVFQALKNALTSIFSSNESTVWYQETHAFATGLLWTLGFLPTTQQLSLPELERFVETLTNRKLRTALLLTKLAHIG